MAAEPDITHRPSGRALKSISFVVVWLLLLLAISFAAQTCIVVLFHYRELLGQSPMPFILLGTHATAGCVSVAFSFWMAKRRGFEIVLLGPGSARQEIGACAAYAMAGAVMMVVQYLVYIENLGGPPGYQGVRPMAIIISITVLIPVVEELYFRGLCLRELTCSLSTRAAVLLNAVVFTAYHVNMYHLPGKLAFVFVMGLATAEVAARRRTVGPCIAMHGSANLIGILLGY